MSPSGYDVIVIGAGPAGELLCARLGQKGLGVAMVESHLVGGECAFYACMPSKALLRPAQVLREAQRMAGVAQVVGRELDVEAVLDRRDDVVDHLDDEEKLAPLRRRGVELIRGHGRLDGERRVRVGDEVHEARRAVVIAAGSAADVPPIPGLADAAPWTNHEGVLAKQVPERLIVLGGGVVGVEMADAYASLGSQVALLEVEGQLLPGEEPLAAEELRQALCERGVEVRLGVRPERVTRHDGVVRVSLDDGSEVEGAEILVALGRRPVTDDLGLESVGLEGGGFIEVDEHMQVPGLPWLYAIGDVNGRSQLTHVAKYQAHVLSEILDGSSAEGAVDQSTAPRVVFTEPQVAAVGLTLQGALDRGMEARAYDVDTSRTPGSSFHRRDVPGTSRIVVDERRGVLVGATFTGPDVSEWLQAAAVAVVGEVEVDRLWETMPVFPTRSEIWLKLLERREAELAENGPTRAGAGR